MKEIQKEKSSDYIKTDSRRRNVRDTGGRHDGMRQKSRQRAERKCFRK